MRRLWPTSLISQMILILLAGLVASHLIAAWIYASDRTRAVRAIGGYAAAQRIANLARLIDEAPPDWRERLIAAAADPRLRITLGPKPPAVQPEPSEPTDLPIRDYLLDQLPDGLAERMQVIVARPHRPPQAKGPRDAPPGAPEAMPSPPPGGLLGHDAAMHRHAGPPGSGLPGSGLPGSGLPGSATHNPVMHNPAMHNPAMHGPGLPGPGLWRRLLVTIQLTDGQWLTFSLGLPDVRPAISWQFVIAMGIMALIVILACIWAVRRVTAPLGVVTQAAERLGRNVNAAPIAETGTREMRQAAHAFNEMQARLQRLLTNRTTMLAALSHDLRTPLTLLRLRIEAQPESEDRDRMLASIDTLDAMIDATLTYARDTTAPEAWRPTDLTALLASIVDDMEDAGMPVGMRPADPLVLECQPGGLRRAVTNLLENAIKYGTTARLSLETTPQAARIVIDDDGPGIPEAELLKVFEPFHRLERSRSRETGGSGLGLAIAQAIAEAHHGAITLTNRPEGGLRAVLTLPRSAAWTDSRPAGSVRGWRKP